jgi:hypothetical protein
MDTIIPFLQNREVNVVPPFTSLFYGSRPFVSFAFALDLYPPAVIIQWLNFGI